MLVRRPCLKIEKGLLPFPRGAPLTVATAITAASRAAAPCCSPSGSGAAGAEWRATCGPPPAFSSSQAETAAARFVVVAAGSALGTPLPLHSPRRLALPSCCFALPGEGPGSGGDSQHGSSFPLACDGSVGIARGCLNFLRAGACSRFHS